MKNFLSILTILLTLVSSAQELKIMTYNIRYSNENDGKNAWTYRKDFFCSQLSFYEPDIFGIQEALPNQVNDISVALFNYNSIGIARDGVGKGEASSIFFKKERFVLLDEATFWLSATPNTISKGWDAALNRVCTYALFKDKMTQKVFLVFNTHLDYLGEIARTKSIALILSKMKEVNTKNYPIVFMGDFNSEPTEERIMNLKKEMVDTYDISEEKPFGPFGTFNGFKYDEAVTKKIDYIFVSDKERFKVKKYAVLTDSKELKYPSDHFPVYIEISFK